jgi:hypothetical protein
MIYIDVRLEANEFWLNINNNVRDAFPGSFDVKSIIFTFTHILSDRSRNEPANVWSVDYNIPSLPVAIWGTYNNRYIEFHAEDTYLNSSLPYDGEYKVSIKNENNVNLYHGIWKVTGNSETEENPFVQYESDNENNDNYIYIEE